MKPPLRSDKTFIYYLQRLLVLAIPFLVISGCGPKEQQTAEKEKTGRSLEYSREVIFLRNGEAVETIRVAVADEQEERSMGLMDINRLPEDRGMLFIFEQQQPLSFWMVNTPLALDIFFVNEDREIVRIHHNTKPFSDKQLASGDPARYVIETNAGFALSHDIREGMKVRF